MRAQRLERLQAGAAAHLLLVVDATAARPPSAHTLEPPRGEVESVMRVAVCCGEVRHVTAVEHVVALPVGPLVTQPPPRNTAIPTNNIRGLLLFLLLLLRLVPPPKPLVLWRWARVSQHVVTVLARFASSRAHVVASSHWSILDCTP